MIEQSTPPPAENRRPIEFRSISEEVAVGAIMGSFVASVAALVLGGLVGAVGASIGNACGGWPILGGSILVWAAFWLLPLSLLLPMRPLWRFMMILASGAAFLYLLQWRMDERDIGKFYPWILSALPMAIVLGTYFEPIRLARGESTEGYVDRGVIIGGGFIGYGNRSGIILTAGSIVGLLADGITLGRQRIGAPVAGFLSGGLVALLCSSALAWRGDGIVADLFFGSAWNIAWACTAIGAITGAFAGRRAAILRKHRV